MEFRRVHTQKSQRYDPLSSSSSSLNYTYFSNPSITYGSWTARNAEPGGVGLPSSLILGPPLRIHRQFDQPELLLHGDRFLPDAMPVRARYGGAGRYYRDVEEFETVPLIQRLVSSPKIIELEEPTGRKRKAAVDHDQSPTVAAASSGLLFCSKKVKEEWRCAVCEISATSERGLSEHLSGKKHQAKLESNNNSTSGKIQVAKSCTVRVESSKGKKTGGDIGLGIISMKKQEPESGKKRRKFKFWCKTCKTGAHDEKVMREHKKGKKHLKNRKKIRKQKPFSATREIKST